MRSKRTKLQQLRLLAAKEKNMVLVLMRDLEMKIMPLALLSSVMKQFIKAQFIVVALATAPSSCRLFRGISARAFATPCLGLIFDLDVDKSVLFDETILDLQFVLSEFTCGLELFEIQKILAQKVVVHKFSVILVHDLDPQFHVVERGKLPSKRFIVDGVQIILFNRRPFFAKVLVNNQIVLLDFQEHVGIRFAASQHVRVFKVFGALQKNRKNAHDVCCCSEKQWAKGGKERERVTMRLQFALSSSPVSQLANQDCYSVLGVMVIDNR